MIDLGREYVFCMERSHKFIAEMEKRFGAECSFEINMTTRYEDFTYVDLRVNIMVLHHDVNALFNIQNEVKQGNLIKDVFGVQYGCTRAQVDRLYKHKTSFLDMQVTRYFTTDEQMRLNEVGQE